MRYFIEYVTTYSSTGKSRKGAVLQVAVRKFEHMELADDEALLELVRQLHLLVGACNAVYRGKPVTLEHSSSSCHICARVGNPGLETYVFSMGYAPMGLTLTRDNIARTLWDPIRDADHAVYTAHLPND